jgi:dihydroneopterin aldolase/2-amino-4-hydroxy-6-hydroxymethyldihydropteridine diphosphokinase
MNRLIIHDLEVFAFHGVHEEEKRLGQKFVVSMEIWFDMRKAAATDQIENTLHYGRLCRKVDAFLKERSYDLIETVAANLCEYILMEYSLANRLKICLKKPWAPIHLQLDYVAVEMERSRHLVYIALGSNLGDREKNLRDALTILDDNTRCRIIRASGFYETEPEGYANQGKFINAVTELETLYSPEELMELLLETETVLKRERTIQWGPRTIDLDILLYDDLVLPGSFVTIPHPRMTERLFVMEPLCEIAPYVVHPILRKTMNEIKGELL